MYADYDQLPQNLEAEESLLGAILIDPFAIDRVKDIITADDFFIKAHQLIYESMVELHRRRKKTDLLTVTTWLSDKDQLDLVGGQPKLGRLANETIGSHNIDLHAQLIRSKAVHRQLMQLGHDITTQAARPLENPLDLLTSAKHQLKALESTWRLSKGDRQDEIDFQLLDQELEEIEAIEDPAKRRWLKMKLRKRWGIRSSRELDELHATWLMGKKTLSLKNPREFFKEHSKNIKFHLESFIPEKSLILLHSLGGTGKTRLVMTMIRSLIAATPWGDYQVERPCRVLLIQSDQGSSVTARLLDVGGFLGLPDHLLSNLAIPDQFWSIDDIGALKKAIASHKPDVIVIDSLTSVNSSSIVSENDVEYARPLIRLRAFAEEFGCTFLIIHHSNQQGGSRGTSAIRNTVDEVWKLEKDTKDPEGLRNLLTIEKTRSRAPATYRLQYDDESAAWTVTDKMHGEQPEAKSTWKASILTYLQQNQGQGFTRNQIEKNLDMNAHTCRRELSGLLGESLINSCKGTSRSVLYYWGDIYPSNASDQHDQHDQKDQGFDHIRDHIANPDTATDTGDNFFKDQNDHAISNFVSDQNLKNGDLFDHFDHIDLKPLPDKVLFKDRECDQTVDQLDQNDHVDHIDQRQECHDRTFSPGDRIYDSVGFRSSGKITGFKPGSQIFLAVELEGNPKTEYFTSGQLVEFGYKKVEAEEQPDQPDRIFKPGDRLVCPDGGLRDLEVLAIQPNSVFLTCKFEDAEETEQFTDEELLKYGYQRQAESLPETPHFPSVGDRVYRVPDKRKRITLVITKVTSVTPSGANTDSNYHISKHCWNKGEWKPAPNPETDLPLPHSRILIELDGEWVRGSVDSVNKQSFKAQGPHCRQYTNLKKWRWPE